MDPILDDIQTERDAQDKQWGEQNHHPLYWLGILGEEFGEVAKVVIENPDNLFTPHGFTKAGVEYRTELIQVAAVAAAAVENLDRNGGFR